LVLPTFSLDLADEDPSQHLPQGLFKRFGIHVAAYSFLSLINWFKMADY
jgi:hypothetical protein